MGVKLFVKNRKIRVNYRLEFKQKIPLAFPDSSEVFC
jgi:hypothetical protein